nr:microplusin 4 [Haemaphysalis flava]
MKAFYALAFFAVLGLANTQEFSLCTLEPEARHTLVDCLKTHMNAETLEKFTEVKQRLQCDDLDCVFTKVCERDSASHSEHSGFFSDETKAALRTALTECRSS